MTNNEPMLTGLFRDRDSAERAYQSISDRGYSRDDVNLVMSDDTRKRHFSGTTARPARPSSAPRPPKARASAARSAAAWARSPRRSPRSARRSHLPGLGLVIAGPLAAAIAGAGAGAATGGIVGALIGWGIPEERVKEYDKGIREGGILMAVRPRNDEDASYLRELVEVEPRRARLPLARGTRTPPCASSGGVVALSAG